MDSPQLSNLTDFAVLPHILAGREGEVLAVIVKATFLHKPGESELTLAPKAQRVGIRGADVPWGDPEKSSIRYPSDLCLVKPGTDVIVVAAAHAPGGKAAPWFDAGIKLGGVGKTVRLFGLRVWEEKGAGLSAPRPVASMDVRYDFAWGGCDFTDPTKPLEEPRNPVGMGIARDPAQLTHQVAPSIEDPTEPIKNARTAPPPAGLGAIGRHWMPRRKYWGTYDQTWLETRSPLLPKDQDDRANLCASPGLTANPPLLGGEECALLNLTPAGNTVRFRLPKIRVTVELTAKQRVETQTPYLDTVVVDTKETQPPFDVRVEMVWRAVFVPPRRLKDAQLSITEEDVS